MYVGIDLAWGQTRRSGVAVTDEHGRLTASASLLSDEDIAAWLAVAAPAPRVVAVDAPLVVPNATGSRLGERLIGQAFGKYGASAYPSNRSNPLFNPPRAYTLARRFGWDVDPAAADPVCLEVYPHPALIGLFGLQRRLLYKKGPQRQEGFETLMSCLESVPELQVAQSPRWVELRLILQHPGRGDLDRIEDEIDAILCAHLAWLWRNRPGVLKVYGDVEQGYIVAPEPPQSLPDVGDLGSEDPSQVVGVDGERHAVVATTDGYRPAGDGRIHDHR
jgi:predicted RNase H-like nuclease